MKDKPNHRKPGWRLATLATLIVALGNLASTGAPTGQAPSAAPYRVVHGWPHLPDDAILGEVSGVAVDSHNRVFVFRRAENSLLKDYSKLPIIALPAVMVFDGSTGTLVDSWGANAFSAAHGLAIDRQDNVWLTDLALQQVYKYTPDGKLLMTLGERGVSGQDAAHFNKPTDVAFGPDGSFFVSDGELGNNRVVKFSADGKFLKEWGNKGTGPGQFDTPHSIDLDASGKIYVAERGNARIQVFDPDGNYLTEWKGPEFGRPWAIRRGADGFFYVVDGGDMTPAPTGRARILKVDPSGKVVASFGRYGNYDGQFVYPHDLAIGADGAIYVGDVSTGMRVQKFIAQ